MDSFVAILYSKNKLTMLHGIIKKIEELLKNYKPNLEISEEHIIPINIKPLLKDVNTVLANKDSICERNPHSKELTEHINESERQLVSAIQVLTSSVNKLSSNYMSVKVRELLIVDAKFLLESVAKFLSVMHEVEEKKFEKVCTKLRFTLSMLKTTSIEHFKATLQEFSCCVQEFIVILDERVKDLISRCTYHQLSTYLNEFKRLFSTLYRIGTFMMANPESKMFSWTYIIRELDSCIEKIICISKTAHGNEESNKETGQFVKKIDQLLHHLSLSNNTDIRNVYIEELIKDVLHFSMDVSNMANNGTQQEIMQSCQQVMRHHSAFKELFQDLQADPSNKELRCEILTHNIERLESIVNIAILQFMAEKFPQITRHFLKAINSFKSEIKENDSPSMCAPTAINNFFEQADHLYQVCRFAVACSTDHYIAYRVLATIESLENLDPEITPTISAFRQNPEEKSIHYHVDLIRKLWKHQMDVLISNIIAITDVTPLLSVLRLSVAQNMDEAIESMKVDQIEYIIGCAEFAVAVVSANKCYDTKDTILQKQINELKIVTTSVRSMCDTMNSSTTCIHSPRKLRKHIKILVHCVGKLCDLAKKLINQLITAEDELTYKTLSTEKGTEEVTPMLSHIDRLSVDCNSWNNSSDTCKDPLKISCNVETNSTLQIDITDVLEQLQAQSSCFTFDNITYDQDLSELLSLSNVDKSCAMQKNQRSDDFCDRNEKRTISMQSDEECHSCNSTAIERLRQASFHNQNFSAEIKTKSFMAEHVSSIDLDIETTRCSCEFDTTDCKYKSQNCTANTTEENTVINSCNSLMQVLDLLTVKIKEIECCKQVICIKELPSMAKDISELSLKLITAIKTRTISNDLYYSLAKAMATKGESIAKFVLDFISCLSNKRTSTEFYYFCQRLVLICHQLHVISSVEADIENKEVNVAIVKSVENLLKELMSILSLQITTQIKTSAKSMFSSSEICAAASRPKIFQKS